MHRFILLLMCFACWVEGAEAQTARAELTVEMIMRDPSWMGTSPSNVFWSEDGKWVCFNWRTGNDVGDSLYKVGPRGGTPQRVALEERWRVAARFGSYSRNRKQKVFVRSGDVFLLKIESGGITQLTETVAGESNAGFTFDGRAVLFQRDQNLFRRDLQSGKETQLTNFSDGPEQREPSLTEMQKNLRSGQLELFDVLRSRKEKREAREESAKSLDVRHPKRFPVGRKTVSSLMLSPDERIVTFTLTSRSPNEKRTIVPSYVTESGFTEELNARSKVGDPQPTQEFCIYDIARDSVFTLKPDSIPGVLTDSSGPGKKPSTRDVLYYGPAWSDDGKHAFVRVHARDNKDRWIVLLDSERYAFGDVVERQHDDAWIGGPGITGFGGNVGWMPDSRRIWFQSEEDGWSHLYVSRMDGSGKRQLTRGKFEVYGPSISRDKKRWYFSSNEAHYGERHLYSMPLDGGNRTRITSMEGRHDAALSPDEDRIAALHSTANSMPELYLTSSSPGSTETMITRSPSEEFRAYLWRMPEILSIEARDGAMVPARLYKPDSSNGAAVIFVHGAGYLQNAHKWWSSYFREYMFHNLLADKGYTVLDLDYRASAGLGRDWRTAIYRHMGGKDLEDQVDGARWLVQHQNVDARRIGMYGGSYGGFITLMAMFTTPGVFAAGAALRPVTDWAHYNHGYTSNILNIPQEDTIAYRRSSPIYHAEGLRGTLLICHGMVDVNVHFQDAVRVVQRLIELKKENWELAVYPVEDHGFVEPTSWMDEYKRILSLFEKNLR